MPRTCRAPTLFERAARRGVKSALLTAKKKTVALLSRGTEIAIAAEAPTAEHGRSATGTPPPIYSREINYWLWEVAVDLLKNRPDLRLLYVHTTDYPMHTWPPSARRVEGAPGAARRPARPGRRRRARRRVPDHRRPRPQRQDALLGPRQGLQEPRARAALRPLGRARPLRQAPPDLRRDRPGSGSSRPKTPARATEIIRGLEGVEAVMTREEAARRFHLMPERIGELVVLGDKETVFGETGDRGRGACRRPSGPTARSTRPRSPSIIYNASGTLPPADRLRYNFDMTRTLYRDPG